MKRTLLTLLALTTLAFGAMAAVPTKARKSGSVRKQAAPAAVQNVTFGYCDGYLDAVGLEGADWQFRAAIYIDELTSSIYKGNDVTTINIGYGRGDTHKVTVFITEDLTAEEYPYTQEATIENFEGWNYIILDEPYPITGKPFYVGYEVTTIGDNDYPIGFDGVVTYDGVGDFLGIFYEGEWEWEHMGDMFGSLSIQMVVSGDNLPEYYIATSDIYLPWIAELNEEFNAELLLMNYGLANVESVKIDAKVGGKTISSLPVELDPETIATGQKGYLQIVGLTSEMEGLQVPVELTISEINGNAIDPKVVSGNLIVAEGTYPHKFLVEEWTGTWCGFCPRGIVGMEYMEENYGDDKFIGIAVHGGDAMEVSSYETFLERYGQNYPGCIINRQYMTDPSKEAFQYYYDALKDEPSYGKVEFTADYSPENPSVISVEANAEFALDTEDTPLVLAFAVTEDNYGPFQQTNYFSYKAPGGPAGNLPGWTEKPYQAVTYFNDVARSVKYVNGIPRSLPSDMKKGETYKYQTTLETTGIRNINNCKVVAMILNTKTREVVNAEKFYLKNAAKVEAIGENILTVGTVPGAIYIEGEYAACNVYGIDGSVATSATGGNTIAVAPGIYIVKATGIDGHTVTRKVVVR